MKRQSKKLTPRQAIEEAAKRQGVSVEEYRFEIAQALRLGAMNQAPECQAFWRDFPIKDRMPTPEEFIAYTAMELKKTSR